MIIRWSDQRNLILLLSRLCTASLAAARYTPLQTTAPRSPDPEPRDIDRKFFKFVSRPDIDAPKWSITVRDETALADGYWFVAPYQDLIQQQPGAGWVGPHIYDSNGELVWSGAGMFQHWNVFDFGVTTIGGKQMLTLLTSHGQAGLMLDKHYQVWKAVDLERANADMHAFRLIDGGSRALVITWEALNTTEEEAAAVGFRSKTGCAVQHMGFVELDVDKPSTPVFSWSSYKHIGLDEVTYNVENAEEECSNRWDVVHINSIDKFADDDYLISSRHTDAVYKISHKDGSIVWRLGGVYSDFQFLGPGNPVFSRQHHAQVLGQDRTRTVIALLDNAVGTGKHEVKTNSAARGLILLLDTVDWTASILAEYRHPDDKTVSSRGSFQVLPNGNAFVCWTYSTLISEYTPNGTLAMKASMLTKAHTYRAFKSPWTGRPLQSPDVVSQAFLDSSGEMRTLVYVSWNGATDVESWVLHRARADGTLDDTSLATVKRTGFETMFTYLGAVDYVVVEALNLKRASLGSSVVVRTVPLDEQESVRTHQPSAHVSEPHGRTVVTKRPARLDDAFSAFLLGFGTCMASGTVMWIYSRRRVAVLSRSLHFRSHPHQHKLSISECR